MCVNFFDRMIVIHNSIEYNNQQPDCYTRPIEDIDA